mmetsp:Transcript_16728/g.26711  ORF Transcript_16728/g.26711 Transcript_16728/m.26711 type:complete len:327 (+) Transcript_16728:1517-2497(+)
MLFPSQVGVMTLRELYDFIVNQKLGKGGIDGYLSRVQEAIERRQHIQSSVTQDAQRSIEEEVFKATEAPRSLHGIEDIERHISAIRSKNSGSFSNFEEGLRKLAIHAPSVEEEEEEEEDDDDNDHGSIDMNDVEDRDDAAADDQKGYSSAKATHRQKTTKRSRDGDDSHDRKDQKENNIVGNDHKQKHPDEGESHENQNVKNIRENAAAADDDDSAGKGGGTDRDDREGGDDSTSDHNQMRDNEDEHFVGEEDFNNEGDDDDDESDEQKRGTGGGDGQTQFGFVGKIASKEARKAHKKAVKEANREKRKEKIKKKVKRRHLKKKHR